MDNVGQPDKDQVASRRHCPAVTPVSIISYCDKNSENYKCSTVAEMGDHGHNRHRPKIGVCAPFWGG